MDETACNYDMTATLDDGSCEYPEEYYDCDGNCINDSDGDETCDELEILGCTDSDACNYDNVATDDDGLCEYPECDDLCETCDLMSGSIYITNDSELWYNVTEPITGFQIDVYGVTITGILNADAEDSDFIVEYQNGSTFSRILGYSLEGNSISPGCGTLLGLQYEGTITDVSDIIFATTSGEQMDITYPECPEE